MNNLDIFIRNSIYPNAGAIFSTTIQPISRIKNDCIYVLDTNALLLPYYTSSNNLESIKTILEYLVKKDMIYIPGQSAREFAANRPERIKEIFQTLNQQINTIKEFRNIKYPLLGDMVAYQELTEIEKNFNAVAENYRDQYKKKLNEVLKKIKDWTWNDPISEIYKSLFTSDVVFDIELDKDFIKQELERRYLHKIPPGYKDQSKPDDGIGDLLIWYTILEIGKKLKKHVIFVSGEEKSDWLYKSEGQTLYTRYELVNEFMNISEGCSFHLIKFSEFLELMSGTKDLVTEMERIEMEIFHLEMLKDFSVFNDESFPNDTLSSYSPSNDVSELGKELSLINSMICLYIQMNETDEFRLQERFIDNLTMVYRRSSHITYDIYKRLMHIFTIKQWDKMTSDSIKSYNKETEQLRLKLAQAFGFMPKHLF